MSTAAGPVGGFTWPTDPRWQTASADTELSPYRVKLGDEVYDQGLFTSNTECRYHAQIGGIGSGKTVGGIIRTAANVEEWNPGEMGMIITPTSLGIKNVILPELSKWGFLNEWEYYGPQSEAPGLHAPNGARILLESADNDRKIERLRGPSISWFWMDEAALIPKKAWDILVGRLRTGNYRNAFLTTTPKGYNWVYDKFVDPDTRLDSVNNVLGVPSFANPHLPIDYRRDILAEYEGQFHAQEVLGEFVKFSGLVYPWFDREDYVVSGIESNIRRVFYGVDWGFEPHPACILAIGKTTRNEYVVLECHYEKRNTVKDLAKKANAMQDRHGIGPFYCDPSEPSNIETFKRKGLAARKADNSVTPGIQHVTSLSDQLRVMDTCQPLIDEFNQYQWEEDGEEPEKVNDHAMDALRYALFTDDQFGGHSVGVEGANFL